MIFSFYLKYIHVTWNKSNNTKIWQGCGDIKCGIYIGATILEKCLISAKTEHMPALWPPNSTFKKFSNRNKHICLSKTCVNMYMHIYMTPRQSCPALCDSMNIVHQTPLFTGFSRQNTRVGCCALLQGIFPTQGSNPHHLYLLLHWQAGFFFFFFLTTSASWEAPIYVY